MEAHDKNQLCPCGEAKQRSNHEQGVGREIGSKGKKALARRPRIEEGKVSVELRQLKESALELERSNHIVGTNSKKKVQGASSCEKEAPGKGTQHSPEPVQEIHSNTG